MTIKLWLKIGEAAQLLGVSPKELRYWESVIPEIRPRRSKGNLRYYHVEELPRLERIRDWLREGLTVADCQQLLKTGQLRRGLGLELPEPAAQPAAVPTPKVAAPEVPPKVLEARKALSDLLARLQAGPRPAPARRPAAQRRARPAPAPADTAPAELPPPPTRAPRKRRNPPAEPADPNDFGPLFDLDQGR